MANLPLRRHFLQNAGSLRAHDPDQRVTGDKTDQQGNGNKKPVTVNPVFLSLQKGGGFFRVPAARNSLFPLFFFNHIDGDHVMLHRLIQYLYRRGRIAVFNRHKDFDVRLNTFKRNAQ
ncbi:hypothetical protein C7421_10672 [Pantoea ananatis]|nr:hypothetical protein C7421_10672 [Pantoea ananatis]